MLHFRVQHSTLQSMNPPNKDDTFHAGDDPSLATFINYARTRQGLTVRELARRADVPASQISRVERGQILKPASDFLISLAVALGRPPEPLLFAAGHITSEEFEKLSEGWRAVLEDVELAYSVTRDFMSDGNHLVAAQGIFFGPGAAEIAGGLLSLGEGREQQQIGDLLNMWLGLSETRRKLLLAFASDQEQLSRQDRLGKNESRYSVKIELQGE